MTDFFIQAGISNACVSLAIAIVALVVGKFLRRPNLAYLLWLLALVKLLIPPLMTLSILPPLETVIQLHSVIVPIVVSPMDQVQSGIFTWITIENFKQLILPIVWGLGSLIVLAWSLIRVFRFNRLLLASA